MLVVATVAEKFKSAMSHYFLSKLVENWCRMEKYYLIKTRVFLVFLCSERLLSANAENLLAAKRETGKAKER